MLFLLAKSAYEQFYQSYGSYKAESQSSEHIKLNFGHESPLVRHHNFVTESKFIQTLMNVDQAVRRQMILGLDFEKKIEKGSKFHFE